MNVPGKIGRYCKYKNIKEFLSYTYDKFNEYDLKKESDSANAKLEKEKMQKFMKKINCEIDILREESAQIAIKKVGLLEKKLDDVINQNNNRFESISNNIIYTDIGKKVTDLIDFYNSIKIIKNDLYERINIIENNVGITKDTKNVKNDKKDFKVSFSLEDNLLNNSIKNIEKLNYSKMIKYHSLNINKPPNIKEAKNNKIMIKNQLTLNLQNINEEIDENDKNNDNNDDDNDNNNYDYSPLNNSVIKSVNFTSYRFKSKELDSSINKKKKRNKSSKNVDKKYKYLSYMNHHLDDNSTEDEGKKKKIEEEIIVHKNKKEKKEKK